MKNLIIYVIFIFSLSSFYTLNAQESIVISDDIPSNYLERNPIYDYPSDELSNTDSIPDFSTKTDKLKITGTIYMADGVTPAKDVILFISQPDENGDYELKTNNEKRYVYHRGWVKTDADGQYTFYTFIPGSFLHNRELKHIHPVIKEPGKPEQELAAFLFDNDPFLSKSCRKRLAKKGMDSILKLEKQDTMFVATKNIVLNQDIADLK